MIITSMTGHQLKEIMIVFFEYPNFCRICIGLDLSNFYMNQSNQTLLHCKFFKLAKIAKNLTKLEVTLSKVLE